MSVVTASARIPLPRLFLEGRAPDASVAECGGRIVGHGRFRADVAANAARLRRSGCRRGLLVTRDAYWGAVGLLALMQAGAEVIVPQNGQPGTLAALAGSWDHLVKDATDDSPAQGECGPVLILRTGGERTDAPLAPLDPGALLTFFTSGSTGAPKRVPKTLAMLEAEAEAIEKLLGGSVPADGWIQATVSHQHVYGLAFRLGWPLSSGRPFGGTTHELWETALASLTPGAALITSPAHLGRLDGIAPLAAGRRPSLVLSAGAPLPEPAARAAAALFGVPTTEIFGSTETGAAAWRLRDRRDPPWSPLPGVSVERDGQGLMRVRSAYAPGGLHVGSDLVELDEAGGFHFRGRNDRIVKIEGKRVSLPEVEEHLRRLPWVADAAALPLGEPPLLAAAVVPSAEGAARLAELGPFRFGRLLRRSLSETQEPAGLPRRWRFPDRLPAGTLGKRRAADIEALFEEDAMDRVPSTPPAAPPARPTEPEVRAVRPAGDGAVELELHIPPDLAYLDGHFPGMPIVPGVVQIDWVVRLAARHLALAIDGAQSFQVKFRRVTVPGVPVTLTLRRTGARPRLAFEYRAGQEILTSGSVALPSA